MLKSTRTAIAFLIVFACAGIVRTAEDKKPTVKLKNIAVKRIALADQTAETTVAIEIQNPGPAFKIKDASYQLKLNGQPAAEGKHNEEINVPANSTVTVELPVTVNLAALPAVTLSAITGGLNLSYELETQFTVPLFAMFNHKVKTAFKGDFTIGDTIISLPGKLIDRILGKP
jgi:LEA14-like dessication related protein